MEIPEGFEVFDAREVRTKNASPMVTIQQRGNLMLNPPAYAALGFPRFVTLLYNRRRRQIAFRPEQERTPNSIPVRTVNKGGGFVIAGVAFAKTYDIVTGVTRRYAASLQEDCLIVDLSIPGGE